MRSLLVLAASTAVCAVSLQKRSTTDPTQLSGKIFDFIIVGGGTAGLALLVGSRNGQISLWRLLKQEPMAPNIKTKSLYLVLIFRGESGHGLIYSAGMSYINGLTGTS
jgi:hypothetical protein